MSSELLRHPGAYTNYQKIRGQENRSIVELRSYSTEQISEGEPISLGQIQRDVEGHVVLIKPVVEAASKADIQAREEEQLDRARRMLEIGRRLTPQWMKYVLNSAPHLLLSE